jgi:succinate dehydrogenase hydrophobic anchor subunit
MRIRESTLWLWFLIAGLVIFAFLGIHIVVLHLSQLVSGQSYVETLSYSAALQRAKSIFFTVTYIILLAALLYHGLYGLRSLLIELFTSRAAGRAISWVLTLIGLATFAYGTYTAIIAAHLAG